MDDVFQPSRPATSKRDDIISEPLCEDPPAAMRHLTREPPREQSEAHLSARRRQIGDVPDVPAVNSPGDRRA
jgi:hypothetical protein